MVVTWPPLSCKNSIVQNRVEAKRQRLEVSFLAQTPTFLQ